MNSNEEGRSSQAICLGILLSEKVEGEQRTRLWFPEELDSDLLHQVIDWVDSISPISIDETHLAPSPT